MFPMETSKIQNFKSHLPQLLNYPQKNMLQIGVAMNVIDVTFTT